LAQLNSGGSGLNDNSAPTDASSALGTPTTTDGGLTWVFPLNASQTPAPSPFVQFGIGATSTTAVSLVDGIYTVTVHANLVNGAGGTHLAADSALNFHRLFGDVAAPFKSVNNADYLQFRNAFGSGGVYNKNFDYNADGQVNNADYLQFRNRFGKVFTYT